MRTLVFLLCLVFLPSCFLKQEAPATTNPGTSEPVDGYVALEDFQGAVNGALILGRFAPGQKARLALQERPSFSLIDSPVRAPKCVLRKGKKSAEDRASAYLTAGKMLFGPAFQTSLIEIERDEDNQYIKQLQGPVSAGMYQVKTEGAERIAKISGTLSMPESMIDVAVNPSEVLEEGITIKNTEAFHISWKSPALDNDANISLLDLMSETSTEKIVISCAALEKDLISGQNRAWGIAAEAMRNLPPSVDGQIYLSRLHAKILQQGNLVVEFDGIRSNLYKMTIE